MIPLSFCSERRCNEIRTARQQLPVSDCFQVRVSTKLQKATVSQARNESRSRDASASHGVDPILTGTIFHVAQYKPVARYPRERAPKTARKPMGQNQWALR
jgi:hypothetical protein